MRIVISLLNYRPGAIGGAETYLQRLIPRLVEAAAGDEVCLLVHRDIAGTITPAGATECLVNRDGRQITKARILEAMTPYRARWAERALEDLQPDVVFFPQQSLFPKRLRGPVVMTVLDVQHLVFPKYHSLAERVFRAGIYRYSVERSDRLIAISEYTRRAVLQYYPVPPSRVTTVPLGWDVPDQHCLAPVAELPARYWYYPAVSRPHKNHLTLLRTWAKLRASRGFADHLVLSGKQTSYWTQLEREIRRLGLSDRVRHLGFLTRNQVDAVYANAAGVLFPSIFEGFGLPVVEAAAWGKKILVSPLEVYSELGVPAECQVDFSDSESVLRAMRQGGPTQLLKAPVRWTDCACSTLATLRRTAEEGAELPGRKERLK